MGKGQAPNRVGLTMVAIVLGGGIALVGITEVQKSQVTNKGANLMESTLMKEHHLESSELMDVLHSNYNIETYVKNPELIEEHRAYKDNLTGDDKNALEQLINKVSTK